MIDLKQMSLSDLKALAYDQLALIEQNQNNLKIINAEIAERNTKMREDEIGADVASDAEAPVEATETLETSSEEATE